MKRLRLPLFVTILVVVMGALIYGILQGLEKKEKLKEGAPLPSFSFQNLEGRPFTHAELSPDLPLLVKYFSPTCEYCQSEMEAMLKDQKLLEDAQIIMVSADSPEEIQQFVDHFRLTEFSRITILHDSRQEFESLFGDAHVPSTYLYGRDLHLVEYLPGEQKPEYIDQLINQ